MSQTETPLQPITPRPAATVMLLRDGDSGLEVFLQRRVKAMAFAPSVTVFPGGGVDKRDRAPLDGARWSGPPPSWWAERFGCAEDLAAALVCAAVRETFEECGVLLAGTPGERGGRSPADLWTTEGRLAAARAELVDRRGALAAVLAENDWVLRADLLRPWSNWITPEVRPRRYDTRFFVAALPPGQRADDGTTEVSEAGWYRPAEALDAWQSGDIDLLPPTWASLRQLAEHTDTASALREGDHRVITPLVPGVHREGDQDRLTLPEKLGFDPASVPAKIRNRPAGGATRPADPDPPGATTPPAGDRPAAANRPTGRRGLLPERPEHPDHERLRPVTAQASVLLAANPSPMTLEGTNTWLLRGPDSESVIVIDPGPGDERHLRLVAEHGPVERILLTHHHHDHAEGAPRLAELTGAPVQALDPALVLGDEGLAEGDVIAACGIELRVLATPGHTSDSLCFVLGDAVLTGDTVLGRGTTVIAHPDGRLGDYLGSLRRLAQLPDGLAVLPGHGPELTDAGAAARQYLAHRKERLEQVSAALQELGVNPAEAATAPARRVVEIVYADVDQVLWPAADRSVRAQLDYLAAGG